MLNIWNPLIQQLVSGDRSGVRLAFALCDKQSIVHWWKLNSSSCALLGLPYLDNVKYNSLFALISTEFNKVYQNSDWHDSLKYLQKLKCVC